MKNFNNTNCIILSFIASVLFFQSCALLGGGRGSAFNAFPIDKDIELGNQVAQQIASDPATYPLLPEAQYANAYGHLRRITQNILNSGQVFYKDQFKWQVNIIKDDKTLNAFCTPGGHIYVYTGLIKYLDNETQLAGVMGHEIAHADNRHSTISMTQQYGVEFLIAAANGGKSPQLAQLAESLILLKFSRKHETQADEYSVKYLYPTSYDPRGAKYFFEKLISSQQTGGTPEFLSTHPNPKNRVDDITKVWQTMGARADGKTFDAQYAAFKNSLP